MRTTTLYLAAALISRRPPCWHRTRPASAKGADARINAAIETAVQAGLPASLLERKVAEGEAKHVPMARIADAVERRLDALTRAQDALLKAGLGSTTEGELSVAADAVQAGVSQSALVSISQRAPEASPGRGDRGAHRPGGARPGVGAGAGAGGGRAGPRPRGAGQSERAVGGRGDRRRRGRGGKRGRNGRAGRRRSGRADRPRGCRAGTRRRRMNVSQRGPGGNISLLGRADSRLST